MAVALGHNARVNVGKSGRGRDRRDVLPDYWQKSAPDLSFGEERFRVTCFRGERQPAERKVVIDDFVTAITWEDSEPILTGTLTLQKSEGKKPMAINEGNVIRLEVAARQGGKYRRIWDMRIMDSNIGAVSGEHGYSLGDEMAWLAKSRDDWQFRKAKSKKQSDTHTHRPKGWTADQIAREVCRRYGVKVGKLAKGTKRINNLTEKNASPLDIIMKAYKLERGYSGRRFVVRMRGGQLQVVALRRSKTMLLLGETLLDATIQRSLRKTLATAAHVTATVKGEAKEDPKAKKGKKGHKQSKLSVDVIAKRARERYGYVRKTIHLDDPVGTKAEARREAKRELVKSMRPNREVNFDHPGISTLFRGDAIHLRLPELGLQEIVYVTGVAHSVSSGDYSMSVTCKFADPYIDKKGEEIRKKRCEKARKHNRTLPSFCAGEGKRPVAVRNAVRADRPPSNPARSR